MKLRSCIVGVLAILSMSGVFAQKSKYVIDTRHSVMGFTIKIAGGMSEVDGSFRSFQGTVLYDSTDVTKSEFDVSIDVASVSTGVDGRDAHLRDEEFFAVSRFPTMTFRTSSVTPQGNGYLLQGALTMRGVTKEIEIAFRRTHSSPVVMLFGTSSIIFEGTTKLNRKDFGVLANTRWNSIVAATGELAMADEVGIRLKIIAEKRN